MRPAATSHIPPNMYASPAFLAGGGVIALLYGMVLFAALSGQRRDVEEADTERPPAPTVALREPWPTVVPPVAPTRSPEPPKAPDAKVEAKAPKPTEPPRAEPKPAPTPAPADNSAAPPAPKREPKKAQNPPAKASRPQSNTPGNGAALALNTAAAKPAEPTLIPSIEGPTFPGLSAWLDPERSSKAQKDDDAIVLTVPAGIHILSPEMKHKDSPRSLIEVTGDFELQVRVGGKIRPGSEPLEKVPIPIAFQGAGLLLWQDEDNYLRFERAAMSGPKQPLSQKVMVETCREGRPGNSVYKGTSDGPVYLRMTRRGDEMECAYSPDGKTWIVVKKSSIALFPDKVQVGIAASNLSPKPFPARFETFTLERGGAKNGSH